LASDVLLSLDRLEQLAGLLGCAFVFAAHQVRVSVSA
jgi:hypothetical protein